MGKSIPLIGRGFGAKSPSVTDQVLINMYREPQGDDDRCAMAFYPTPGTASFVDFFAGAGKADLPSRAKRTIGQYMWDVVGNSAVGSTCYYTDSAGNKTEVVFGTAMTTSSGRVGICDNGSQVIIVDGVGGWTAPINSLGAATAGLTKIADVDFPNGATSVDFLGGYFVVDNPAASRTGQFNWCKQYDGTVWDGLDFDSAESSPDGLLQVFVNLGQLFLCGKTTTEVWALSGDENIFSRVGGAGIEWGLAAKWTISKYANSAIVMFGKNKLGQSQPVRIDGYTATPLTDETPGGPDVVSDMNSRNVSSATGYAWELDGHSFYQLNFPDKSYLYDDMSRSYSEISSNGGRHIGEIRAELNAVSYVSDYNSSKTFRVDSSVYTDNGNAILRTVQTKHLWADDEKISINEFVVSIQPGVGLVSGQGSDPLMMLTWSKDGGFTWGNVITQKMGEIGRYFSRVVWRNLGWSRDWMFRITVSDPVKVVLLGVVVSVS